LTVATSTQFSPPDDVQPGYVGFPSGFPIAGWIPLMSNPVCVYESPLSKKKKKICASALNRKVSTHKLNQLLALVVEEGVALELVFVELDEDEDVLVLLVEEDVLVLLVEEDAVDVAGRH
jgi:hypothetical protein